jgi:hypothetical protein
VSPLETLGNLITKFTVFLSHQEKKEGIYDLDFNGTYTL